MARKLNPAQGSPAATPAKPEAGVDDLATLNPDITFAIAGRQLTIPEPTFYTEQVVRAKAHALARDLTASIEAGEALTDDLFDVMGKHVDLVCELIAEATDGADVEWVRGLSVANGDLLRLAWWGVWGPFFTGQMLRRLTDQAMAKALLEASAGPTSSTPSPHPATATPTTSNGTTPAVN